MFSTFKPLTILLTAFYTYGYPVYDSVRPAFLDAPLTAFHEDVVTVMNSSPSLNVRRWFSFDERQMLYGKWFAKVDADYGQATGQR